MYDKIIIGAGLYGLYAALYCAKKGQNVLVIEKEQDPFMRATYINQARVHMGYHGQQLMNLSFFAGMSVFLVRRFR